MVTMWSHSGPGHKSHSGVLRSERRDGHNSSTAELSLSQSRLVTRRGLLCTFLALYALCTTGLTGDRDNFPLVWKIFRHYAISRILMVV